MKSSLSKLRSLILRAMQPWFSAASTLGKPALSEAPSACRPTLQVLSLYKAAFRRLADPTELANCVQQLQAGGSLDALAEGLATSPEFHARHGPTPKVDTEFLNALYRDGLALLGSPPPRRMVGHRAWLPREGIRDEGQINT